MGTNIHAFAHRLTALSMACLASAAFTFCALSGFGCSFVKVEALEGRSIGNSYGEEFEDFELLYMGVQCLSDADALFFAPDDTVDRLWNLSRIFFYIGLGLGALTALFAWLLSTCVRPTALRWRILSVLAACSAVVQIPVFLVFESDNCNFDVTRQSCNLSTGAYLNIVSVSIWIIMTIWVQCLRAPRWDEELDAWKVDTNRASVHVGKEVGGELRKEGNSGDDTVETSFTPKHSREEPVQLPSQRLNGIKDEQTDDIERQHYQQHNLGDVDRKVNRNASFEHPIEVTEDLFALGRKIARQNYDGDEDNDRTMGKNVPLTNHETKKTSQPIMRSLKDRIPRIQITKSARQSSSLKVKSSKTLDKQTNLIEREKSFESNHYRNNNDDHPSLSAEFVNIESTKNKIEPGCHISCIYSDGTTQEAHFPSVPNCCIGMTNPLDMEDDTHVRKFTRESCNVIDYDGYDGRESNVHSDSADFLVRKLRMEERAAEARQAERKMAPVASFQFVTNTRPDHPYSTNHRKESNNDDHNIIINDDISEMTRGSGWASGVSEILDDADLRHQSRDILDGLQRHY